MNRRILPVVLFAVLFEVLAAAGSVAAPGDLLSLDYERSYSPQESQAFIMQLYEGYEPPQAEYTVDVYQAVIESRYPDGSLARMYAQVFLPVFDQGGGDAEDEIRNIYVFGPGSTGLIDNCRPSREHEAGIRWGLYRSHVLSHAMAGTIGFIPDYLGFRDPGRDQYYMVAEAEAHAMLDCFRAFREIRRQLQYRGVSDTRHFTAGFSQGGHAAFAAAEFRSSYAPEVPLDGVIGYGPTTNVATLMLEYPSVAPMMVYTYSQLYGESAVNPAEIFRDEYAEYLEDDVLSQCVGAMQSYYPHRAKDLYRPEFHKALIDGALAERYPELNEVLLQNSPGYRPNESAALILQGSDDIVVFPPSQVSFVAATVSAGNRVDYRLLQGYRHDTRQIGYYQAREWMDSFRERKEIPHVR